MEFFSIGTLLASLTEAHMPKAISDTLIAVNCQQRDSLFCPWAAVPLHSEFDRLNPSSK